ncbi:uncharacterized protein LOC142546192 isoform X2 [Primulina tabacum]|uniref:uncharacterized protein LOC142546192 isoform X2 n=1 Tax=Primulina tabacum TaxID=48773 RepID=UPI003F59DC02
MSTKEAMDSGVSRRRASAPKAGSVWETRMKLDEFKGGIKVFNADHPNPEENARIVCTTGGIASPVNKNEAIGPVYKGVGAKQSPVRGGSGSAKRKTWKSDGFEGSPIQIGRQRSEVCKNLDDKFKESTDSADGKAKKTPVQVKKTRPISAQMRKVKSDSPEEPRDENSKPEKVGIEELTDGDLKNSPSPPSVKGNDHEGSVGKFDKILLGGKSRSEEELDLCEVEEVASNADKIKNTEEEDDDDKKVEVEIVEKNLEIKEISSQESKPKKSVIQEKKLLLGNKKSMLNSPIVKKQLTPAMNLAKFRQNSTKFNPNSDNSHGVPRTRSKLQTFADLIMWRDVAKSSFIFGMGTFAMISSSYTKDLNISFISVVSYLGLAYLAVNFLFRSLISRVSIDNNPIEDYVIGEEEAIWAVKLLLPCVNEFLLKLRALFSGDPVTTMKLAVLLFVLGRCGSSVTMWKMAKLGFIGVFTLPKVCSSYSVQITAYGIFWIRRFSDVWESCTHKKAVGFATFSLVWNLSSVIARIWTVFMLYVAFKCYQHSFMNKEKEEVKLKVR